MDLNELRELSASAEIAPQTPSRSGGRAKMNQGETLIVYNVSPDSTSHRPAVIDLDVVKPSGCAPTKRIPYARTSMKECVDRGAGGGLWTGSQPIDSILLNQPLRSTKTAAKWVKKGGSLNIDDWPDDKLEKWLKILGRRNGRLLELTRLQNLAENCSRDEMADPEALPERETKLDLKRLADEYNMKRM